MNDFLIANSKKKYVYKQAFIRNTSFYVEHIVFFLDLKNPSYQSCLVFLSTRRHLTRSVLNTLCEISHFNLEDIIFY